MARLHAAPESSPAPAHQPYRLAGDRRTLPTVQTTDCVVALRALGEDTRVRIVGLLLERRSDVATIADRLGVSQYNVSKHLRVLREAGLLEVEKDGRQRLYALPDAIRRQAAEGRVLDLGCCSFQFEESGNGNGNGNGNGEARSAAGGGMPRQAQAKRRGAHKQHARRK